MRMLWGIICLALLAVAAHARPSPPPPSDFRGDLYVDSTGCVFNRDGRKWVERKLDGRQICGFPPSLSPLRHEIAEDTQRPPDMAEIEQDLLGTLASALRQGEHVADRRDPEHIAKAPPAPGQEKFRAELTAMMRRDTELQSELSGSFHANNVCKRLGYSAELDPRPILGWDVTMGLCPGTRTTKPQKRIAFGKRLQDGLTEDQKDSLEDEPVASKSSDDTNESTDDKMEKIAPATQAEITVLSAKPALQTIAAVQPSLKKTAIPELSDQTAKKNEEAIATIPNQGLEGIRRYVEVGIYHTDQNAEQAIRNLMKMGYQAAQAYRRQDRQTVRIIYAGPFDDQTKLSVALNTLRTAGYDDAAIR